MILTAGSVFSLDIVISLFGKNNLHYDSLFLASVVWKTYQVFIIHH